MFEARQVHSHDSCNADINFCFRIDIVSYCVILHNLVSHGVELRLAHPPGAVRMSPGLIPARSIALTALAPYSLPKLLSLQVAHKLKGFDAWGHGGLFGGRIKAASDHITKMQRRWLVIRYVAYLNRTFAINHILCGWNDEVHLHHNKQRLAAGLPGFRLKTTLRSPLCYCYFLRSEAERLHVTNAA